MTEPQPTIYIQQPLSIRRLDELFLNPPLCILTTDVNSVKWLDEVRREINKLKEFPHKKTIKMKNAELYHKTVNILVEAYFNDTLAHSDCSACAVGNIVAYNKGLKLKRIKFLDRSHVIVVNADYGANTKWFEIVDFGGGIDEKALKDKETLEQISCTGYSPKEIVEIEHAFENCDKGNSEDEFMFNGLCAVIDALDVIHDNKDTTLTATNKAKFSPFNRNLHVIEG
jgi:hypothetical protein